MLALQDYYSGQQHPPPSEEHQALTTVQAPAHDKWALSYISVLRIQPLIEAFDDDASGFVTVSEANTFTAARPEDWRQVGRIAIFYFH